jgi:DNA primase
MGTALTDQQLKQLSKFARRLILALDPDVAGAKATMRGLDVIRQVSESGEPFFDSTKGLLRQASRLDVDLQVMTLPEDQDPDDVIRETPDKWREFVENAQPVAEYVMSVGTAGVTPQSPLADREKVARELLPILVATENNLQEQTNIQQLAFKLRLDVKTLMQWAADHRLRLTPRQIFAKSGKPESLPAATKVEQEQQPAASPSKTDSKPLSAGLATERYCLSVLLRNPGLLVGINRKFREIANKAKNGDEVMRPFSAQDFTNTDFRAIFSTLQSATSQYDIEPEEFLERHLPYDLRSQLDEIMGYSLEYRGRSLLQHESIDILQVRRDLEKFARIGGLEQELRVLEQRALELRKARLRRENLELQFLQKEQEAEPAAELRFLHRVSLNITAIRHIEAAMSQLAQAMR